MLQSQGVNAGSLKPPVELGLCGCELNCPCVALVTPAVVVVVVVIVAEVQLVCTAVVLLVLTAGVVTAGADLETSGVLLGVLVLAAVLRVSLVTGTFELIVVDVILLISSCMLLAKLRSGSMVGLKLGTVGRLAAYACAGGVASRAGLLVAAGA